MRIGIAGFTHETHTFYPTPTTVADFEVEGVARGAEVVRRFAGTNSYIAGFLKVLEQAGATSVPILAASAGVANRLTRETYEKFAGEIVEGLRAAHLGGGIVADAGLGGGGVPPGSGPLDGVLLSLHGAMAAEGVDKPEAELVRRVRAAVGAIPIMVSMDFHANEDQELTDAADAVFIGKLYPHTDTGLTGEAAARCLLDTLAGRFHPVMVIRKPGIISPSVFQGTGVYPMKDIRQRADDWERREPKVRYVSVAAGFGYADVPDVGATVIALTDGDRALAEKVADDVAGFMWEHREGLANKHLPKPAEAVTRALELVGRGVRPVVLADHSDRTGDAPHILDELLRRGAKNVGCSTIWDPAAVASLQESGAKVGDTVTVTAGGHASPYAGPRLRLTGTLTFLGNGDYVRTGPKDTGRKAVCGATAVLRLAGGGATAEGGPATEGNNYVVLTSLKHQAQDGAAFRAYGIDFDALDIILLKSRVHFRAYFDRAAGAIIEVDAPGLGPADLRQFEYRHIPDDIYPIGPKCHA